MNETHPNINTISKKYIITVYGEIYSKRLNKYLKKESLGGYYRVSLYLDGKKYKIFIHRLVALAYRENILNKPFINHIDGNKENNYFLNLEWVTNSENILHASINLLNKKKLTIDSVKSILSNEDNLTQRKLAKKHGCCVATINEIINKKIWKEI